MEITIETCPECGKEFKCITYENIPGFREVDTKYCPYCGAVLGRSGDYEWSTYKLEDE